MTRKYALVVRDEIYTSRPKTDETLKRLDCYYESPVFSANGTEKDLNAAIEKYRSEFARFIDWTAELVEVKQ